MRPNPEPHPVVSFHHHLFPTLMKLLQKLSQSNEQFITETGLLAGPLADKPPPPPSQPLNADVSTP